MEESKKPWQSKTLITNLVVALGALFAPGVSDWISANPETMVMVWAALNTVLRFVTKKEVTFS